MSDGLRFDQRYGVTPLPSQLRPHEVSDELKAKIWAGIHTCMTQVEKHRDYEPSTIDEPWRSLLYRWHVNIEHRPSDEFRSEFGYSVAKVKSLIYKVGWAKLYTFLEFIAADQHFVLEKRLIARALESGRAAWRLVGDDIVPVGSPEEAKAIGEAIAAVSSEGSEGAKAHLRQSSKAIAAGDWSGSIRESIHAVEATAKQLTGAGTLGEALKALPKPSTPLHPALIKGFLVLYGYTSDERGIRHALLEQESAVSEAEALFMFGACASFCQYLLNLERGP